MSDGCRWAKTLGEVADVFGVSTQTVKVEWRASGIVPRGRGPYDLREIIKAKIAREVDVQLRQRGSAITKGESKDLLIAKLEKQVEKLEKETRKIQRDNRLAEGELLLREEVEKWLSQWVVKFRAPLMRIPDKIASRVPANQKAAVKREVADDIHAALNMVVDSMKV